MTKQTWTAAVSAVLFVLLAAIVGLVPVPYVSWSAGSTVDLFSESGGEPNIAVSGVTTYPTSGQLRLTTVSVTRADSSLTLPEAFLSYWLGSREVLPRDAIYPAGVSVEEIRAREVAMMDNSQSTAVAAALRAAEVPVTEIPLIVGVSKTGPAANILQPGDFILKVDGRKISTTDEVRSAIRAHKVGEAIVFTLRRDREERTATVKTAAANNAPSMPVVGINLDVGYSYEAQVSFHINSEIGGPSAGLMFALGVYDKVTEGDLVAGRSIAGTGTITGNGAVGSIGGIQEKIAGAQQAGSTVFLVPAANCPDVVGVNTSVRLVKVATLQDAVEGLSALRDPATAGAVAGCS